MAAIHRSRRREDVSSWVLTSLAISLLVHVLLMHVLGSIRLFDVEVFTSAVSRWFNVVEVPETVTPPELATYAKQLPQQAESPQEPSPTDVPLIGPNQERLRPSFEKQPQPGSPQARREPSRVRLPDTELAVVHHAGPGGIDQTRAALGEVAPVRGPTVEPEGPSRAGRRTVGQGLPGLPGAPPVSLALSEVPAPRPGKVTHRGALAPPKAKPDATPVELGEAPPAGIVIPMADLASVQEPEIPQYVLPAEGTFGDQETTPVIPFGDEVDVAMTMYAEPGNPRLYFRLEIAVAKPEELPAVPKDVMFIIDVSLSMKLREIRQARRAIVRYLGTLRPEDRFNVVAFSEQPRKLFPDFVPPTPERMQAVDRFVDRIPGQIKTDVYRVLWAVVRDVAKSAVRNRPTNIFFISDGRSTSGIRDARRIVNDIGAFAQPNFAVFAFDAGRGGNRYLLDLLAYRSRGTLTYTEDIDGSAARLARLFADYDQPVLLRPRITYTNLEVDETYPAALPNLYADQPIVLYGRCTPGQDVTIRLQGDNPSARRALEYSHKPGAPDPSRTDIAREWARRKIHHIVSDMAKLGETAERRAEIERLGRKYNVRTLYEY
ncbi:MAG: VWA domain-containing protein [Candidatus Brocadiia bacterium]